MPWDRARMEALVWRSTEAFSAPAPLDGTETNARRVSNPDLCMRSTHTGNYLLQLLIIIRPWAFQSHYSYRELYKGSSVDLIGLDLICLGSKNDLSYETRSNSARKLANCIRFDHPSSLNSMANLLERGERAMLLRTHCLDYSVNR